MLTAFLSATEITTWIFVGLLVVLVVVLLVVPMFTNKKRAKQTMDLHNSLMPGDVIKTVGGIIGTIKEIKQISPSDREMIIETGEGDNKTTMTFDIQALYQIIERAPRPESSETNDVFAPENKSETPVVAESEEKVEDKTVDNEVKEQPEEKATVATADDAKPDGEEIAETPVAESEIVASEETVAVNEAEVKAPETAAADVEPSDEEKPVAAPKAKKAGSSNTAGKKKPAAKNSAKK